MTWIDSLLMGPVIVPQRTQRMQRNQRAKASRRGNPVRNRCPFCFFPGQKTDLTLITLDLLRAGSRLVTRAPLQASDYRILVSRAGERTQARYWPVELRQPLPVIGIPLRGTDPDVPLDLGAVLNAAYDHGA